MGRTIADELKAQGRKEGRKEGAIRGRQQVLLRLLDRRFGTVPAETVATIEATTNVKILDGWLDGVVTAPTLDEVGIG
jgi:hypothetical protein